MAIPLALSFVGLWFFPRYSSERYLLTYLVVASLIFYLADACYSVPMNALILEATGDYHERTRVNVFTQAIVFIASIAVQWAFPFTQLKIFSGTLDGVRCFAIIFGLLIASMALIPCFINREPLYNNIQLQPINSFSQSIKATIRNRPFIILIAIRSIYTFSYNIVGALGLYLNYYYVFGGDVKHAAIMQGWNGTIFQISAIASLLFYRNFAIRYGKGRAMACAGGILALGSIGKLFLYVPGRPWLQIFIYIANGAAGAGSVTMANAALADIADYGELATGARQEGAYIAVLGWFDRIGNSMGSLISGFFLVWVGFNAKLGGHQSLGTLRLMQFAYFFVPFLGAAVIVWLSIIYPLNESSCYRIKRALESRRMVGPSFLNLSG
jgi:GPH family glycoside/pentoside/hexuronide:cation symporter